MWPTLGKQHKQYLLRLNLTRWEEKPQSKLHRGTKSKEMMESWQFSKNRPRQPFFQCLPKNKD